MSIRDVQDGRYQGFLLAFISLSLILLLFIYLLHSPVDKIILHCKTHGKFIYSNMEYICFSVEVEE